MADLHLSRDPDLGLRAGLERSLRDAVRSGRLRPGERLPSSRDLAGDLGVARNTVADVYTQLVAEGYLISARGSGTRVATTADRSGAVVAAPDPADGAEPRFDLRPGRPDLSLFPYTAWLKAVRTVLLDGAQLALGYGDPRGPLPAREAIAAYLARTRGVVADPQLVILGAGYRQAVSLVAAALRDLGRLRVAVESPGLPEVPQALHRAGLDVVTLPVDEHGARVDQLGDRLDADAVTLTPAHQFPAGVPLSSARRTTLVEWAHRSGGIVLEDDYDGEFRYDRQPIGSVQGLAPDQVTYAGSISKTLAPGLRLGWLVVPAGLLEPIVEQKRLADRHSSALDHLALAQLIRSGEYDRHVRRARSRYRTRRGELTAGLAATGPQLRVAGVRAGLHALVPLPSPAAERDVLARLADAGVVVNGLARYTPPDGAAGLVIGYATPPQHLWRPALAALIEALGRGQAGPATAGRSARM